MKKLAAAFAALITVLGLLFGGAVAAPSATADTLPNGLTVTCTPDSSIHITCIIGGCPRVHGDYVVDAVHVMSPGGQNEYGFKCINGEKARWGRAWGGGKFTIALQACRKKTFEGDWCTAYNDYTYTPPARPVQCPPGSEQPTVPAGQTCKAAPKPDVVCPAGSTTKTVPAGQTCKAAPKPAETDAISASFSPPTIRSIDFVVGNRSSLPAVCEYAATTNSLNPLIQRRTVRSIRVAPHSFHTETFVGPRTFTRYEINMVCGDVSGQQTAPLGQVKTSVVW